jgi:hypothetical protein
MVEYGVCDTTMFAPELWAVTARWVGLREANGALPDRGVLAAYLHHAGLAPTSATITRLQTDFVVALCGFGLIRRFGRLAHGERVGTLAQDIADDLHGACTLAFEREDVVVAQPVIRYGASSTRFDEILLPLSVRDNRVLLLVARERQRAAAAAVTACAAIASPIAFAAS